MSLAATNPREESVNAPVAGGTDQRADARRWRERLIGLLVAILCLEVGVFLTAFPWSRYWSYNYFAWLSESWREVWVSPYFRGAVSGLGLVNLYLVLVQVFGLQRSAAVKPGTPDPAKQGDAANAGTSIQ